MINDPNLKCMEVEKKVYVVPNLWQVNCLFVLPLAMYFSPWTKYTLHNLHFFTSAFAGTADILMNQTQPLTLFYISLSQSLDEVL